MHAKAGFWSRVAVLCVFLVSSFTAATAIADAVPPGKSVIYLITRDTGAFSSVLVSVNGKIVGTATPATHFVIVANPGATEIGSAGSARGTISLTTASGGRYYVAHSIGRAGSPEFHILSESDGQAAVTRTRKLAEVGSVPLLTPDSAANKDARTSSPDQKSSGVYLGIGIGSAKAVGFSEYVDSSVAILQDYIDIVYGPVVTATGSGEDSSLGGKLFVGYNFNKYLALEGFYTNFGEFKTTASVTNGVDTISLVESYKTSGFGVAGLGMWSITNSFSLFGKFGLVYWNMQYQATLNDPIPPPYSESVSDSAHGLSPLFGIGAKFDFSERFGIRAEYERYLNIGKKDTTGQFDIDLISVSGVVRF